MSYIDFCNKYSNLFKMPISNIESSNSILLSNYTCLGELLNNYLLRVSSIDSETSRIVTITKDNRETYSNDPNYCIKDIEIDGKIQTVVVCYRDNLKATFDRLSEKILALAKAITDAYNNLYTDYDKDYFSEEMEGTNFFILNSYAETSKSYEKYDETTKEFSKFTDYWYTRGHYYESIPKGIEGKYIEEKFQIPNPEMFNGFTNFCDYIIYSFFEPYEPDFLVYREIEYQRWVIACMNCQPDPETGKVNYPPEPDYADDYWKTGYGLEAIEVCNGVNSSISKLDYVDNMINSFLNPVWQIINDFKEFKNQQKFYITVFESYQNLMNKVNTFMNNEEKSSSSTDYNLFTTYDDVYNYNGLKLFCPSLENVYKLFLKGKEETQNYKNEKETSEDLNNVSLQKVMNSFSKSSNNELNLNFSNNSSEVQMKITNYYVLSEELLTYGGKKYNYWSVAPLILNWIINFRNKYNLTTIEGSTNE